MGLILCSGSFILKLSRFVLKLFRINPAGGVHFVSTAGRLDVLSTQERVRWRQHNDGACPVEMRIQMPEVFRHYFAVSGVIDRHNRIRQDSLNLEKSVEVKDWSFRMNCTLLGIVLVDGYLLYQFGNYGRDMVDMNQFWIHIGTELVENKFDQTGWVRNSRASIADSQGETNLHNGSGIHLTPTHKRHRDSSRNSLQSRKQELCRMCPWGSKFKTTWVCSKCRESSDKEVFLCHAKDGRNCFQKHYYFTH